MKFTRDTRNGVVAGVLAGAGRRLGVDPVLLRVGFAVLAVISGGLAIPAYGIAWALIPADGAASPASLAQHRLGRLRFPVGWKVALGVGFLTLAGLLVFRQLGIWWSDTLVWPLVLAAAGAALLWRQTRPDTEPISPEPGERPASPPAATAAPGPRSRFAELYRGGFGVALVIGAALLFLSSNNALGAARDAAFTAIVVLLALALILAPFLWRLGRNLATERTERIRSQERAEMAAHLHDSVLQTLTLMQKRADDPRQVATLARRQERELRSWLFGTGSVEGSTFASALRSAAADVEDAHGVPVEVVAVGDCELDEHVDAMVAAAREAITNAAKFAPDSGPISVYAEVENGTVQTFVHDRGPGFDPGSVPDDRRGVRESIVARMDRHGGRARIRSSPGEGTEVELVLERAGDE